MRRVVWSIDARGEYHQIITHIAQHDPAAAEKIAVRIRDVVQRLAAVPTGRKSDVSGTYEKVVPDLSYIVAYALGDEPRGHEAITILRVIHGARNWQNESWPG